MNKKYAQKDQRKTLYMTVLDWEFPFEVPNTQMWMLYPIHRGIPNNETGNLKDTILLHTGNVRKHVPGDILQYISDCRKHALVLERQDENERANNIRNIIDKAISEATGVIKTSLRKIDFIITLQEYIDITKNIIARIPDLEEQGVPCYLQPKTSRYKINNYIRTIHAADYLSDLLHDLENGFRKKRELHDEPKPKYANMTQWYDNVSLVKPITSISEADKSAAVTQDCPSDIPEVVAPVSANELLGLAPQLQSDIQIQQYVEFVVELPNISNALYNLLDSEMARMTSGKMYTYKLMSDQIQLMYRSTPRYNLTSADVDMYLDFPQFAQSVHELVQSLLEIYSKHIQQIEATIR